MNRSAYEARATRATVFDTSPGATLESRGGVAPKRIAGIMVTAPTQSMTDRHTL
ncbi:MAG: hypothetical protein GY826_37970 [Fuerstiella sp.]|nr:hypothetical protein [Fuerstiella sp.]